MKKVKFFKEVEKISKANELANKVEINTNDSYSKLHNQSTALFDYIDDEFFGLTEKGKRTETWNKHANSMIKLELLIDQMNVIYLFEAVKNSPDDNALLEHLEIAKLKFLECYAQESVYIA